MLINIFGAPKSGKTTMMASITAFLKLQGVKCEMAPDYPKEVLYEERFSLLKQQLYILAVQEKRIHDLYRFSDVVITDCPILHSVVYNHDEYKTLHPYIFELHEKYNNLNFIMLRTRPPDYGCFKIFTPEELEKIQLKILDVCSKYEYTPLEQIPEAIPQAIAIVSKKLKLKGGTIL